MSYNLLFLLNVNHEKPELFRFLSEKLESNGSEAWCLDQSPDMFFAAEYMKEGTDAALAIEIPYGGEETTLKALFDFMTELQERIQFNVLDPQLGRMIKFDEVQQVWAKYRDLNLIALRKYSDGHHFLRNVEERDGRKVMIEAIQFQEETWQNYCSVALAYGRTGEAEKASELFKKALSLDPENPAIYHALGVSLYNMKDYPQASSMFSKSLELDPDNPSAQELLEDSQRRLES